MNTNTVVIRRWRNKRRFSDANWRVQVRTGSGWEDVGYFQSITAARAAAQEVA